MFANGAKSDEDPSLYESVGPNEDQRIAAILEEHRMRCLRQAE